MQCVASNIYKSKGLGLGLGFGLGLGLGKLNCLNQDKAVELLGWATRERERSWKEEERMVGVRVRYSFPGAGLPHTPQNDNIDERSDYDIRWMLQYHGSKIRVDK